MQIVVILAELATLAFFIVFSLALASDGIFGPVFEIKSKDPVARTLMRHAQAAFVVGYSAFFAFSAAVAIELL